MNMTCLQGKEPGATARVLASAQALAQALAQAFAAALAAHSGSERETWPLAPPAAALYLCPALP